MPGGDANILMKAIIHFPCLETLFFDIEHLFVPDEVNEVWQGEVPSHQHSRVQTLIVGGGNTTHSKVPRRKAHLSYFMKAFPKVCKLILTDISLSCYIEASQLRPLAELRILSSINLSHDLKNRHYADFRAAVVAFFEDLDARHLHLGDCGDDDRSWPFKPIRMFMKEDLGLLFTLLQGSRFSPPNITFHQIQFDRDTLALYGNWAWKLSGSGSNVASLRAAFDNCTVRNGPKEQRFLPNLTDALALDELRQLIVQCFENL